MYFKHFSGALCTISQHHEGWRESKVTLFSKVCHPNSDGHPYPNYHQHHHPHYLPHPQHPRRPDHNHPQHRPDNCPHEGENWRVEGNDSLRRWDQERKGEVYNWAPNFIKYKYLHLQFSEYLINIIKTCDLWTTWNIQIISSSKLWILLTEIPRRLRRCQEKRREQQKETREKVATARKKLERKEKKVGMIMTFVVIVVLIIIVMMLFL